VGVKPTYGRVSRYGLVAYASSLDQIGPMTRSVADAAAVLGVISGVDAHDATSAREPVDDFGAALDRPVEGLVLGVPRQARSAANHPGVAAALEEAARVYQKLGATIVEVDLPTTDSGIAAYYIVATAEASSNLARFDGIRYGRRASLGAGEGLAELYARSRAEGFGAEVQRRIMLGTYVLSAGYYDAYYTTALKARRRIKEDFDAAFAGSRGHAACHALLLPSSPSPAWTLGAKSADPLQMYLEDVYTVGVNLAGLPAMSFPGGFVRDGERELPVGLQLVAPAWQESTMLRIARMHERETMWGSRRARV
jgi:aspartyl-tRNA(Asn)/glutamyl-tRNA(Gln) amidotransferase subunit A